MAASELNNRLDYLISYSSQLVFVCSDKIPHQSQVVESFIAHQNEQADLALLTANELTPLVTYREKLFRQLISQNQHADFNLPLNQLLAPLNNHKGPILINVFQAEKLPDRLVKELWDLVLQSRFANNKQQLNVLLMGLSIWAESAKASLGSRSKEQPIVLNSPIQTQHTAEEEFSDLEAFIQDKRQKFAQRIEDRQFSHYNSKSILKNWWVTTLFGLAFLAIFSGILGWQYPEKVKDTLGFIDNQFSTPVELLKAPDVTNVVAADSVASSKPNSLPDKVLNESTSEQIVPTITPKNVPLAKEVISQDVLVTDWAAASAKLEEQSNKILIQSNNVDVQNDITPQPDEAAPQAKITQINKKTDKVNDYKVEDNVQLAPYVEQKEMSIDSDGLLNPTPAAIEALPTENFVIQLAAMASLDILQKFIREEPLGQQLWLYKTQRYGGDWFVLLKNQHFLSIAEARTEIGNLSESMRRNNPFVKSIAQVKQEIMASAL